jgi:hypothetical protein
MPRWCESGFAPVNLLTSSKGMKRLAKRDMSASSLSTSMIVWLHIDWSSLPSQSH